jgi:hypothetical protein
MEAAMTPTFAPAVGILKVEIDRDGRGDDRPEEVADQKHPRALTRFALLRELGRDEPFDDAVEGRRSGTLLLGHGWFERLDAIRPGAERQHRSASPPLKNEFNGRPPPGAMHDFLNGHVAE